jgi:hypothetical protein
MLDLRKMGCWFRNPHAELRVVCSSPLLSQYIGKYPPYLEAVYSTILYYISTTKAGKKHRSRFT